MGWHLGNGLFLRMNDCLINSVCYTIKKTFITISMLPVSSLFTKRKKEKNDMANAKKYDDLTFTDVLCSVK